MNYNTKLTYVPLIYLGILYPKYWVSRTDLFICFKKSMKRKTAHPNGDGRFRFNVTNPITRKPEWIDANHAIHESFDPQAYANGKIACHRANTRRSDYVYGTSEPGTTKDNRHHRKRDGTHSTGHNTQPGKLTDDQIRIIRNCLESKTCSVSELARRFRVTRQAINYHRPPKSATA